MRFPDSWTRPYWYDDIGAHFLEAAVFGALSGLSALAALLLGIMLAG
jgi:hypothetical protein